MSDLVDDVEMEISFGAFMGGAAMIGTIGLLILYIFATLGAWIENENITLLELFHSQIDFLIDLSHRIW